MDPQAATDAELARATRALKCLSSGNRALLRATGEHDLLSEMCRAIVSEGGYVGAWVGYAEHDEARRVRPMAWAGIERGVLEADPLTWADTEIGQRSCGTAIRTGRPCIGRNIRTDPAYATLREQARAAGFGAASSFPLRVGDEVIGCLGILAPEPDAFDAREVELLDALAEDVAYGITSLRARRARDAAERELLRVNRALRTLSAGNRILTRANDEQTLLRDMCRVIVEESGYRVAWVGYGDPDAHKPLRAVASAGDEMEEILSQRSRWADSKRGRRAASTAIRGGRSVVVQNLAAEAGDEGEGTEKNRFAALAALPLRAQGKVLGALSIFAAEADAFDAAEVKLLAELADDLAFGVATLRMQQRQREAERTIERLAWFDPLTGLPNRASLHRELDAAVATARAQHRSLALLLTKIGQFQEINDALGYREGDRFLTEVAARLGALAASGQMLARVGEDEFALLLPLAGAEAAVHGAQRLVAALRVPVELAELAAEARASVGIALFPGHATEAEGLIQRGKAAAQQAALSAAGYAIYQGSLDKECARRLALMGELRRAIDRNELMLYCQPKVRIDTGQVCGAEALVRWRHPRHGMLATAEFVKLAEHAGLITPLTQWVLEAAFRQGYAWHEAGVDQPLSVNLSAHDLRDPRLVDRIKGLLATWGMGPELIQFELTESALMVDPAGGLAMLRQLKDLGARLFIDDFGIGYSSLSYLQKLPVDSLKIDQSFVAGMLSSNDAAVIVRSTVDLGHNLDLEVVAEGVENEVLWEHLRDLGCDVAQGYFVARPIPAEEFGDWSRTTRWRGNELQVRK